MELRALYAAVRAAREASFDRPMVLKSRAAGGRRLHPYVGIQLNEITSAERRELRAQAHHLHPVVMISEAGLTPEVTREIEAALRSHELIKIRVMGDDRDARQTLVAEICEATGASSVQHIGKILVIYRPRPAEEEKGPKRRRARKAPRRTKRSFQGS